MPTKNKTKTVDPISQVPKPKTRGDKNLQSSSESESDGMDYEDEDKGVVEKPSKNTKKRGHGNNGKDDATKEKTPRVETEDEGGKGTGEQEEEKRVDPKLKSLKDYVDIYVDHASKRTFDDFIENHETRNQMFMNYIIHKDPTVVRKTAFASYAKFKEFAKAPQTITWTPSSEKNFAVVKPTINYYWSDSAEDVYLTNAVYRIYQYVERDNILEVYYFGETRRLTQEITELLALHKKKPEDIRQGIAITSIAVEQFRACIDSSGTAISVRNDGTRTKKSRREEQGNRSGNQRNDVIFSSESTLSNNMAGFSLPGRLQKSVRVDLGAGISIEDALLSSIKIQRHESEQQVTIARNNLNSAIAFCRAKMHPAQVALLSRLQDIKLDPQTKSMYCAYVSSTLDVIPPTQNKPVLIHPCFFQLIPLANFENAKSIYDVDLLKGVKFTTQTICYEGFLSANVVAQCLANTLINNIYGPLDLVNKMFGIEDLVQRENAAGPLKVKIHCKIPYFSLKKTGVVLNNYDRGVGTESKHQSVLTAPVNLKYDVHKPFLHRIALTRSSVSMTGKDPRRELLAICKNPESIENAKKLMNAANNAKMLGLRLDDKKGYFNNVAEQSLKEVEDVLNQWKEVAASLANKKYEIEDFEF